MKSFRRPIWRCGLMMSVVALLLAACGTFEVSGQLVTPTVISPSPAAANTTSPTNQPALNAPDEHLDVPRLDDAQVLVDISTRLIYRSESDLETAAEFYETQMAADGWTLTNRANLTARDTALTFSRQDEILTVEIKMDWLGLMVEARKPA